MDTSTRLDAPARALRPDPEAAPETAGPASEHAPAPIERRNRLVLIVSSLAALVLMGGVVAMAFVADPDAPRRGGGGSVSQAVGLEAPLPPGCAPDPDHPPHMVFDLTAAGVDFGAVKQGESLEREVPFQSTGPGVLCIRGVGSGCGCIAARLKDTSRTRYEPGERGTILLTLRSEGKSGLQSKAFWVSTNELDTPRHTYPVTAKISLGVVASTQLVSFGERRRGEAGTGSLRLESPKADAPWKVTDVVEGRVPGREPVAYVWEAKPVDDPNLTLLEVSLRHPGRDALGLYEATLVVKTTHPDRPEIPIRVMLNVVAPVRADPGTAVLGYVRSADAGKSVKVHLRPIEPKLAYQVTDVRLEPKAGKTVPPGGLGFTAEQGTEADGRRFVEVKYDGQARRGGLLEAVLVLHLDLPDEPELRIPVTASVQESR